MDVADERRAKGERFRAAGQPPYAIGPGLGPRITIRDAAACHDPDAEVPSTVVLAGRVTARRDHGNSLFLDLRDGTGRVQAFLRRDDLGPEAYELLASHLDLGDIVAVQGGWGRTRKGEVTVFARAVELLTKSLAPLPKEHFGLADVETRLRQRHLDLVANPDSFRRFETRSAIVRDLRRSLEQLGFLEVETPTLHAIAGGAAARPFVTHHEKYDLALFLRIAPELYLKRLLVGGYERVFEIGRNYRNEGLSPRHHPEFTMLEAYWAYARAEAWMEWLENLLARLADEHGGGDGPELQRAGGPLDCSPPFARRPYAELVQEHAGVDVFDPEAVRAAAQKLGLEPQGRSPAQVADDLFGACVERHLVAPTFVTAFPVELSPLARCSPEDERVAERFELFVGGIEVANGFSELTDPTEQLARFERQVASKDPELPGQVDQDYVDALRCGMPPAAGIGVGVDRLVMLITGAESIRDVILFPLLRPVRRA